MTTPPGTSLASTSLASILRAWRDRLTPEAAGLPTQALRRASGLRREDLAALAGISVDYLVRLEQGRAVSPSPQVVAALASALHLADAERVHLYRLAGLTSPGDRTISDHISPGVQRLLVRLDDAPAAVFAADWQLLRWNRSWSALVGDPANVVSEERNFAYSRFPVPGLRQPLNAWPVQSHFPEQTDWALVSDLRRASATYPDDPRLGHLLRRLLEGNADFARLWGHGAVGEHTEDRKEISHPVVGRVTVDCDVLSAGKTDLKIVLLTAAVGSEDSRQIERACLAFTEALPV